MKHLLVTIFIYLTASVSLCGQINYSYSLEDTLFKEGVHFENLNLILPWNFEVTDTLKYGKPVVKRLNKRTLLVKWDTVKILNGITVSFEHYPYRNFLTKGKYSKLTTLYGTIKSDNFVKLKQILISM